MTHTRNRDSELVLAGELQRIPYIVHAGDLYDAVDRRTIQTADIVDRPAFLLPLEQFSRG